MGETSIMPVETTSNLPFLCVCGERFEKSVHMAAHSRWACKMKQKTAQCKVCGSWFATELGVKRHMKHAHSENVCRICNMRFHNPIKLTKHCMEGHWGEDNNEQLECFKCGKKSFTSKFQLECHLLHHKAQRKSNIMSKRLARRKQFLADFTDLQAETHTSSTEHNAINIDSRMHQSKLNESSSRFKFKRKHLFKTFPYQQFSPNIASADDTVTNGKETNQSSNSSKPRHDHIFPHPFLFLSERKRHGYHKFHKFRRNRVMMSEMMSGMHRQNNLSILCSNCKKTVNGKMFKWHKKYDCPIKCPKCDKIFIGIKEFKKHLFSGCKPKEQELITLPDRLNKSLNIEEFPSRNSQMSEDDVVFTGFDREKINDKKEIDLTNEENDSCNFCQCKICGAGFNNKEDLISHLYNHYELADQTIRIKKVEDWAIKSKEYFQSSSFSTDTTSNITTDSGTSEIAPTADSVSVESNHLENIDFLEDEEDVKVWTKYRNQKRCNKKKEIIVCDLCDEKFVSKCDAKNHMKEKHNTWSLECPICHKKFSWNQREFYYRRHVASHKGVEIFKHTCSICGKTFLESSKYFQHLSTHKEKLEHQCNVCGKCYTTKWSLERHVRTHAGIKRYKCTECDEEFHEKRELVRHSSVHTGKAPFTCDICDKGFTLKTSLMSHMKNMHPTPNLSHID